MLWGKALDDAEGGPLPSRAAERARASLERATSEPSRIASHDVSRTVPDLVEAGTRADIVTDLSLPARSAGDIETRTQELLTILR